MMETATIATTTAAGDQIVMTVVVLAEAQEESLPTKILVGVGRRIGRPEAPQEDHPEVRIREEAHPIQLGAVAPVGVGAEEAHQILVVQVTPLEDGEGEWLTRHPTTRATRTLISLQHCEIAWQCWLARTSPAKCSPRSR